MHVAFIIGVLNIMLILLLLPEMIGSLVRGIRNHLERREFLKKARSGKFY